jgi:hypothetical protein
VLYTPLAARHPQNFPTVPIGGGGLAGGLARRRPPLFFIPKRDDLLAKPGRLDGGMDACSDCSRLCMLLDWKMTKSRMGLEEQYYASE